MTVERTFLGFGVLLFSSGVFLLLNLWGVALNGGVFVYPLDDAYIHLSMAEQIAKGEYGINPSQFAAADSSILYPFLLLPVFGIEFQQYMPLILNGAALLWGVLIIEKIFEKAGFYAGRTTRTFMVLALFIAPLSLNMIGVSMLGMEQSLHVLTVLYALYGVALWVSEKRLNLYLIAAILLGPLIRYEAMGLSLLLSAMLFLDGRKRAGLGLATLAIIPLLGFSWFLVTQDGNSLPNSVVRKVIIAEASDLQGVGLLLKNFTYRPEYALVAWLFLGLAALFTALLAHAKIRQDSLALRLGLIAIFSLLGQGFVGRNGLGNRHETYVIVLAGIALLIVLRGPLAQKGLARWGSAVLALAALLLPLPHFSQQSISFGPLSMHNVFDQQWQMGRFARDYLNAPVAVNDIGLPSYRNENDVLDLWGLASHEALSAWAEPKPRGWVNALVDRSGADLAMIYESWILPGVSRGWYKIGYFKIRGEAHAVAGPWVALYATNEAAISRLQALLREFQPTLPDPRMLDILAAPIPYIPEPEE